MTRTEKKVYVKELTDKINASKIFYLANIEHLDSENSSILRKACFENGVELKLVKNTLLRKSLKEAKKDYSEINQVVVGNTSIMFSDIGKSPALVIKTLRKKIDKPVLKAAYIEEDVYLGDENLEVLASLKSKEELVGDVVALLQSPVKQVISALQSSSSKLAGIIKTLKSRNL